MSLLSRILKLEEPTIDPALRARLEERGMSEEIERLESPRALTPKEEQPLRQRVLQTTPKFILPKEEEKEKPLRFDIGEGLDKREKQVAELVLDTSNKIAEAEDEAGILKEAPLSKEVRKQEVLRGLQEIEQNIRRPEEAIAELALPAAKGKVILAPLLAGFSRRIKSIKEVPPLKIPKELKRSFTAEDRVRAINIRVDKISNIKEVQDVLLETARRDKALIEDRTRGVITNKKTKQLADQLGITSDGLLNKYKNAGKSANAEELVASVDLLKKTTQQVEDARKALLESNTDLNLVNFRLSLEKQAQVQEVVSGIKAESGRALQANRILARTAPDEPQAIKAMLDALGGREVNDEIAKVMARIDPTDIGSINKFIRTYTRTKLSDKLYEVWLNSILSNPITHVVNTGSNVMRGLLEVPIRAGKALLSDEVKFGEVPAYTKGMLSGLTDGVRRAVHVFRNGLTPEQAAKIEFRVPAIKGKKGEIARIPTKLLAAEDEFFKAVNGTAELHAQAYRLAKKEGLKGDKLFSRIEELKATPKKEMFDAIEDVKLKTTFQKELGLAGKTVMQARNKIPGLKWIIPFIKTPTNIAKDALQLSPAGFANIVRKMSKGNLKIGSEQFAEEFTKASIGSLIASTVAIHTLEGKITGRAPFNSGERDAFYRSGKQPYSIKVGDTWYSYRRVEPFATVMGLTADIVNDVKGGKETKEILKELIGTIGRNLSDKTFMSGLSNALNAINNPDRHGSRFVEQLVSGLVPFSGTLAWVSRIQDQVIRNPDGIKERVMSRTPFLQENVVPKRNVFGEKIKREGGPALQAFSPISIGKEVTDDVDLELSNLGYVIGFPSNTITVPRELSDALELEDDKRRISLNNKEYDKLLKLSGKLTRVNLESLFSSSEYVSAEDKDKEKAVNSVVSDVRSQARMIILNLFLLGEL